jgi:hypothetical protein
MNEIQRYENPQIIRTIDDAERAARAMSASGFFADTKQASQAIVKILAGQELGFGPFASMTGVHIIQNKPTLAANLMAAAVKRTGKYNYRVTEHTDAACELEFFESGQAVGKSRFTMEDASRAGLLTNPTWKKYPRNMLFSRALSNGQKWFAPDVFNGATVYTPEELGAVVDSDGNVIDAVASEVTPLQIESTAPAALKPAPIPQTNKVAWTVAQKQALIDAKLADNDFAAKGMLGLSNLPGDASISEIVAWGKAYREHRTSTNPETNKPYTAPEAAEFANNAVLESA